MKAFYRSGEIAKICGCSPDTIRHYEDLGLIEKPVRSENRYRQYPQKTIDRVKQIRAALTIGFSLNELSRIFKIRDTNGIPCAEVRDLAKAKLHEVQLQIRQMNMTREKLQQLIKEWDELLKLKPPGKRAGLLGQLERKQIVFSNNPKSSNLKRSKK